MKIFIYFLFSMISTNSFSAIVEKCGSNISQNNYYLFCEKNAKKLAESCALEKCNIQVANNDLNSECIIISSKTTKYYDHTLEEKRCVGYAVAREVKL